MRQPEGTKAYQFTEKHNQYKRGAFYWLDPKEGESYVEQDIAKPYDPNAEPKEESDLPKELPGRDDFKDAGFGIEEVIELYEDGMLQSVNGIGPKTEEELEEFFLNLNDDTDE